MLGLFDHMVIGGQTLKSKVELDETLMELTTATDYEFTGETTFKVPSFIKPKHFSLGVIVGGSGTGKSSLLKEFGEAKSFEWDSAKAVASQVEPQTLMRLGLSSIPSLCRPFHVLSEGEKHRAEIARALTEGVKVIDEFTSYVHRDLAMAISIGTRKMIDREELRGVVVATCHEDVIQWLEPDWVFNTSTGDYVEGRLKRPSIDFKILPCSTKAWSIFSPHHYLSSDIHKAASCWVMTFQDIPVGFCSALPFPSGSFKRAYREHRLCILPDYQGLGIGTALSDYVANLYVQNEYRYFTKTAHIALGKYREKSPKWRATSMNLKSRASSYAGVLDRNQGGRFGGFDEAFYKRHLNRVCYCHEYQFMS